MEIRLASGATEADIVQALANMPNGGTLVLPANEIIQIKTGLLVSVTQRDITIDLNGSTLQQAGNVTVISGRGDHAPLQGVSLGADGLGHTMLTYGEMPADLKVGAWVKVVADDVLPGDHLDGTLSTRLGQALQVVAVEGNTVTLGGALNDQALYQTNVRAAAFTSGELTIKNGEIVGDQSQTWNAPLVQLRNTVSASVEEVTVRDGRGTAISVVNSVNAEVTDAVVKNMLDAGNLGIAVHSLSSTGTTVQGLFAENVTHAADDNAIGNVENAARTEYYGGDIGMSVSGSVAYATRNFAWSWHSEANGGSFDDVMAFDSYGFLMARGIGNTMTDSGGAGNQRGVVLYEWGDGDGRNITIDGVVLKETNYYSTTVINAPTGNLIQDSFFEAYGVSSPVGSQYATTVNTTYVRADADENDVFTGTSADERLLGGKGNDTLDAGEGNDYLWGGIGNDTLTGGLGRDRFAFHSLSELGDVITDFAVGSDGDMVDLSVLAARLDWGRGDLIASGHVRFVQSGADTLLQVDVDGGGNDFVTLATLLNTSAEQLGAANVLTRLSTADQLVPMPSEKPPVVVGTEGVDALRAGERDTTLQGLGGDDSLFGGGKNDVLDGGAGADWMGGGAGDDVYMIDAAGDVVAEAASNGFDTIRTEIQLAGPLGDYVEALVLTGTAALSGRGNALNNVLTGNAGANALYGEVGDDMLVGADGNDTLDGGDGQDRLEGGAGNDSLNGGLGQDALLGGDGTDRLLGGDGDDLLDGGQGADTLSGGMGSDTATYADASIGAIADLAAPAQNAGAAAGDSFSSVENLVGSGFADTLRGNQVANLLAGGAGDDGLFGAAGVDTLRGEAGNDVLDGGAGKDLLTGGADDDVFWFTSVAEAGDTIRDFVSGQDRIALSAAGFGFDPATLDFVAGTAPTSTDATLLYANGQLQYDADGSGAGKAVLVAVVTGAPALTMDDFLLT